MTDPLILAFDTSGPWCAAAVLRGQIVLGAQAEDMARGQAERLIPLLEEMLAANDLRWADLDRIGVGVGPGNFTGIRIGVSAARGFALSLGIPAIGVSSFEAARAGQSGMAAVAAPRDMAYVQMDQAEPEQLPAEDVPPGALWPPTRAQMAISIGRLAAARAPAGPPAPLYVRPADAAPPSDPPPVILDDA